MKRRLIIVVLAVGVLLGALIGFNLFRAHMIQLSMAQNASPPQTVTAAKVDYSDWQPEITAVGSVRAIRGVDVTTEVTGLVRSVNFRSGEQAHAGQVLVQLNADADIAQWHALESAAELSDTVLNRDKAQYEAQGISKAVLDTDTADLKGKRAQAAAQAALVAKKTLRAPFAGRLGITLVNPGQYLNTGDKVVTLQAIDTVYVDFKLPQQELARISTGQAVTLSADAYPGQKFTGLINAIDPQVDTATRNFQIEAAVENPDHRLLPGMFVRVVVASGSTQQYLTLPQTAVAYNPYGATVFLAKEQLSGGRQTWVAQQIFVTPGSSRGDQVTILKGLSAGQLVVTSGSLKLNNGTPLVLDDRFQPRNDPNPAPQEE